jgi:hypothetical protein
LQNISHILGSATQEKAVKPQVAKHDNNLSVAPERDHYRRRISSTRANSGAVHTLNFWLFCNPLFRVLFIQTTLATEPVSQLLHALRT